MITDSELSGLIRRLAIAQVMPRAAKGGPFAVVRDNVEINLDAGRIDLRLDATALEARLRAWPGELPPAPRGWLSLYRSLVRPLYEGAVLKPRPRD